MDLPVCLLDGFNPLCLDVFLDFNLFSCWVLEDGTTTVDIVHFFKIWFDCYDNHCTCAVR